MTTVDRLPDNADKRRGVLDAYFGRRLAEARQLPDGRWQIEIRPFDEAEMHVDPELAAGLHWWGCDLGAVPAAVRRAGTSQLSLEDSWTAFAWSSWLATSGADHVTVLHVDDHDDLMAPLLEPDEERGWRDLITGQAVDLCAPATVRAAVESGAIGVAGFFTPFLHHIGAGEVRHLCASGYATERPLPLAMTATRQHDDLLRPGAARPAVRLDPGEATAPWTYRVTADPAAWIADVPPSPVLLHVDFDYFCNRFNGDSDWAGYPRRNDVTVDEVRSRVDALARALGDSGVADRIVDVSGSLSPGFFPAEMWDETVSRLAAGLQGVGLDVPAWR